LANWNTVLGRGAAALIRPASLPALLIVVVMLVVAWYATVQNQVLFDQRSRADVLHELSVVRAKLEGNINGDIQLVRGLIATLATEPQMSQSRFADLAAGLFEEHSQLHNIAAAPDLVVRLMYPLRGNEAAVGLDYRSNPVQRDAAQRARDTGELVLAGPLNLVQGGSGIIARYPVFIGEAGQRQFWGIVSAVVDTERLYAESGLIDPNLGIDIAIVGRDGLGATGAQFFGDAMVLASRPVIADVALPSGSWRLAAIPKGGWIAVPPNSWLIWLSFFLLGLLVTLPVLVASRLRNERQRNLDVLGSREAELQRLSRRLGLALETSQVGVFEYDLETGDLLWDDNVNALFGLPQDGGPRGYSHWHDALHPDDLARAQEEFQIATRDTGRYRSEYRIVTPEGETRHVRAIGAVYKDPGTSPKIVGVNWDVSSDVALNENLKLAKRLTEARNAELEAAKASIEHNALHDSLTGLPNRRYLDEVLRQRAAAKEGAEGALSLLHLDLDRFKQINDTLGHAAGDAVLIHVSEILRANIQPGDFAARIGGDEFVVVSTLGDQKALAALADRIVVRMRRPQTYQGHECRFGVSVGIATERQQPFDPNRLMINADIALYRAKSRGRNRYEFFTEALQSEVSRTKRIADEILSGFENNQFVAHYQPQFDAETLEVVGVEALARWHHPTDGILVPKQFLDVAEDINVVATIDRIVLEQALAQASLWERQGVSIPKISVNVSARRLQDEGLIGSLRAMNIRPGRLAFELVESIFLDETDDVVRWNIDEIRQLGIDIEIDDFGTGYASIVSLMRLKPSRLKIDQQLIKPISESATQRQIVGAIVDIGRSLEIDVLGEGVETMQHAEILRALGCRVLQGHALAPPMSGDDLVEFMRKRSKALPAVVPKAG
jgi:diguanylate cyclase (GGDEF)-like protein/PAS domain S-box-containing protein